MKTHCQFYGFLNFFFIHQLIPWKYCSYYREYCQFVQYEEQDRTVTCAPKKTELFHLLYWQRQEKNYNFTQITII